jgi:fatty acid desaturase
MSAYTSPSPDVAPVAFATGGWWLLSMVQCIAILPMVLPYVAAVTSWIFTTTFIILAPRVKAWIQRKWQGIPEESLRLKTGVWTIHGRKYDLTEFAAHHPGGSWAMELGRNRDCTGLYESYHVFADMSKLDKILAKYELPESKDNTVGTSPYDNATGLRFRDAFHEDVKQMARDFFKAKGRGAHKVKPWLFWCVIVVILAEAACAVGIWYGYKVALIAMPVFGSLLTFNVAHEASHFGFSTNPIVNRLFACTSAPMFFNSTAWHLQHVVQHHVYTNDEPDVDLYHFLPVCRTTRFEKFGKIFRYQWLLIWVALPTSVCHLTLVVPMDLLTRAVDMVTMKRRYEQCENVDDFTAGAKVWIGVEMALSFSFMVSILVAHGLIKGFAWLSVSYSIASALFILMTQGAHLHEKCMVVKDVGDRSWAKRQVQTAINFQPDSQFWLFASGGLNMQALHHILPPISSSHLRDMYPKFKEVCEKHNIKLLEASGMKAFFGGFLNWVSELSNDMEEKDAAYRAKMT